LLIFILEKIN